VPPGPACPLRLTVPVEELPPPTELGDTLRLVRAAAVIVSGADCVLAPWAPEITTDALLDTARVVTVNVAEVEPLGTVTVAGTFAFGLLEERLTVKPAALAGPVSVTVPVAGLPPITELGESAMPASPAGATMRLAVNDVPPCVAVKVTVLPVVTGVVEMVTVAEDAPAGMVTVAGSDATGLLDDRLTVNPPAEALPFKVTVPVAESPPATEFGDIVNPVKAVGLRVMVALAVPVWYVPVMVAVLVLVTALVSMVNVSEVAPSGISTCWGTKTLRLLELRLMSRPPAGAGPFSVAVPID